MYASPRCSSDTEWKLSAPVRWSMRRKLAFLRCQKRGLRALKMLTSNKSNQEEEGEGDEVEEEEGREEEDDGDEEEEEGEEDEGRTGTGAESEGG